MNSLFVPRHGCPGHLAIDHAVELFILCMSLPRHTYFVFGCVHALGNPDCCGCPGFPLFVGSRISVSSKIFKNCFEINGVILVRSVEWY